MPQNIYMALEISMKSGKDSTSTPEFGHTQGEIQKKNLQLSTLAFKEG
jgi:hypothetical protein